MFTTHIYTKQALTNLSEIVNECNLSI